MNVQHYLEDLSVGQRFDAGPITLDPQAIKRFAAEFDPQPFHLDDVAAHDTLFGGLAASGWHTAAVTMRLLVECGFKPVGGVIGAGIEELQWPKPTRPHDTLSIEAEILELRTSQTRPERGMAKVRVTTLNQSREVVQSYVGNLVIRRRPLLPHTGSPIR